MLLANNQLIIATFNEKSNNYEYNIIPDLECLMLQKLKSGKILIINELNVNLVEFSDNQLIIIKSQTLSLYELYPINNKKFKFLSYELLNGDIVFTIDEKRFCYFNIKTFQIKFVFNFLSNNRAYDYIKNDDYYDYKYYIKKFNQFKDKNILYCLFENCGCFKINLKNGKIEKQLIDFAQSIKIDKYIIIKNQCSIIIKDEKNKQLFNKELLALDEHVLINEKSKLFASIGYGSSEFGLYIYIFKINIK